VVVAVVAVVVTAVVVKAATASFTAAPVEKSSN